MKKEGNEMLAEKGNCVENSFKSEFLAEKMEEERDYYSIGTLIDNNVSLFIDESGLPFNTFKEATDLLGQALSFFKVGIEDIIIVRIVLHDKIDEEIEILDIFTARKPN